MTRGELLKRLSPSEYAYWIAYMTREPRGDRRIDVNFGWLVYNIRRALGDRKVTMKDCIISFEKATATKTEKPQTAKDLADTFRAFAKSVRSNAQQKGKK